MSLKTNLFRFIFISVLGVLLHFTYEWSGDNAVVGLFSAVNESTWEHLKLLFFPFLLLTILEVLSTKAAAAVLLLLTVAFFVFTYCPPDIGLFWDPTVGL